MSIALKMHFELEIDALQNALMDIEKLKQLLQIKETRYICVVTDRH
jgi:hypothetical protein